MRLALTSQEDDTNTFFDRNKVVSPKKNFYQEAMVVYAAICFITANIINGASYVRRASKKFS